MQFGDDVPPDGNNLREQVGQLARLRGSYSALTLGDLLVLKSAGPSPILTKHYFEDTIIALIINGPVTIPSIDALNDLVYERRLPISDGRASFTMQPYSIQLWKVE